MVSVVISLYNTEKYIKQCIDSVLRQDYKDIEIIIVDDCSTDQSLSICQSIAVNDDRVKILSLKKNIGLAKNRFEGLKIATGEFIMFLDSDDWLENTNTISIMVDEIVKTDSDYVEILIQRVLDKYGFIRRKSTRERFGLIQQPELFDKYFISFFGVNVLNVNICGKLYRRDILIKANLCPWKYSMGEDLYFNMQLFPHIKRVSLIDHVGYNYRFGGMTTHYNPNLFPSLFDLYKEKKEIIKNFDYPIAYDFIRVEIVNVLISDIRQAIRFIKDKKKIEVLITERICHSEWLDLKGLDPEKSPNQQTVRSAILNKDIGTIYKYCESIERLEYRKYQIKRFISKLLS